MVNLQLLSHLLDAVLLHQLGNAERRQDQRAHKQWKDRQEDPCGESATNLLVFGNRVQELGVQFGVVLSQGLVAIVIDELHHGEKGKRLGEAVPRLSVVDLY